MNGQLSHTRETIQRENISDYVAELQLHMALQARNLVPTLVQVNNDREQFLQQTQAIIEKHVSRQMLNF